MSEWLDIESAPRDGTRVLLFRRRWAENMAVGWYSRDWSCWLTVNGTEFPEPTEWRPTPEPPK